jgi:inner membrane protein
MLFWHWIAFGFALMVFELALPSFFFLWLGIAAIAVGLVMLAIPGLGGNAQWASFAVLGLASFFVSSMLLKGRKRDNGMVLNKRGNQLVGEIVVIVTPVENGYGKAKVGDTLWSVSGVDMPAGARAKVCGSDGTVLKVEAV